MELVKKVVGTELLLFEKKFAEHVKGSNPLLDRIMKFIIKRKGKQMRPMFVLLCANVAGGITEKNLPRRITHRITAYSDTGAR